MILHNLHIRMLPTTFKSSLESSMPALNSAHNFSIQITIYACMPATVPNILLT